MKNNYKVIRQAISKDLADFVYSYFLMKRKVARKDGTPNQAPKLLDANKEPLDVAVGNGSKVNVQYREWETSNNYGDFKGLDLQAVQVVDLVEYTGSDGSELQPIDDDLEF